MFGNAAAGPSATAGPDLERIVTQSFGFLPLAKEKKVRLTSPWTSPPIQTASLLSIASRRGLVAAAGPEEIIIATTDAVRKFLGSEREGDPEIRAFTPELRIPAPTRISHIAFTADEEHLILSAESGGGLAVYSVQSLLQGSPDTAFELPTNGESLRLLAPNPTSEKAELCAVVTSGGNLFMANLKERKLSSPMKSRVSCLSWSAKGKQLCAGMGDGTISQMTPEGEGKAEIPPPPNSGNCYVSSLLWLENNLFLAIYTAANEPISAYHVITRQPPSSFTFQKLTDPVEPFGAEKAPHHAILRLRDFLDMQDLLIISSTASTEIGTLTRAKVPLDSDKPAASITNKFTTTEILGEPRRPTLPMTEDMDDSVAIGVALDLSSKDKVRKPIPSNEDVEESSGPLPGFWVLTQEGILCAWWLVYDDAVVKNQTYPGLSIMDSSATTASNATQETPMKSAMPFATPSGTSFGSTTPASAPAFGSSTQIGAGSSPWGSTTNTSTAPTGGVFGSSTFGSSPSGSGSTFGKTSALGFGQSSQLGMRTSPWSSGAGTKSAFGQSGFSSFANGGNNQNSFASANTVPTSSAAPAAAGGGAFAGFSSGGFASLGTNGGTPSGFGSGSKFGATPFGTAGTSSSTGDSAFSTQQTKPTNVFGSTPFKLESSFKPEPQQNESSREQSGSGGSSMFSGAFESALGDAANDGVKSAPGARDEDMEVSESTENTPRGRPQSRFAAQQSPESTTPTSTPIPPRFGSQASTTPGTSLFGQPTRTETSSSSLFGTSKDAPKSGLFSASGAATTSAPTVGQAQTHGEERDTPLPPDTTSKAVYTAADSSSSSAASDPSQLGGSANMPWKAGTAALPSDSTAHTVDSKPRDAFFASKTVHSGNSASSAFNSPPPAEETQLDGDAPLPPDFTKKTRPGSVARNSNLNTVEESIKEEDAPLPPDFVLPKAPGREVSSVPQLPETVEDESDFGADDASEGSGVDVAQDLSPSPGGFHSTLGFTPQSSFGGLAGRTPPTARLIDAGRPLFGELNRNAPIFPVPNQSSPRSPSPLRAAVPQDLMRSFDATRSVSAPGMASKMLGTRTSHMQNGSLIPSRRERQHDTEHAFMAQQRRLRERQEAEEKQVLVDEEDDEVQKIIASEVEGTLDLDEFIAHSNVVPPARESVPAQVEAVYRDINSMIDTLGLNARAVKAFIKGHRDHAAKNGRTKDDLEIPDDWVLCEIDELGEVLDGELYADLEEGRVQDLRTKLEACQDLSRDMQRLRAKQDDMRWVIMARMDPDQAEYARSLPLSTEQAAQQGELRREYARCTNLLTEAEEALSVLKAKIATMAASSASGRGSTNMPTVEAVLRTISKMTSMAEKRSGDVDVLETQLRRIKLGSTSRENSPMMTPQGRRRTMMSPDSTPLRNPRHSLTLSSSVMSLGGASKATPPRKKMSGFSEDEKSELMRQRTRRLAVLSKFKESVKQRGPNVWTMDDIE